MIKILDNAYRVLPKKSLLEELNNKSRLCYEQPTYIPLSMLRYSSFGLSVSKLIMQHSQRTTKKHLLLDIAICDLHKDKLIDGCLDSFNELDTVL